VKFFPCYISFAKASTLIFFSQRKGTRSEDYPIFISITLILPFTLMFIVGTFGFWITIELETEGAGN